MMRIKSIAETAIRTSDADTMTHSPFSQPSIWKKSHVATKIIGMVTMSPTAEMSGAVMLSTSHPLRLPS